MACVSGSNIVSDGLVFHFDMENRQKSWKGAPTTNLFQDANKYLTYDTGAGMTHGSDDYGTYMIKSVAAGASWWMGLTPIASGVLSSGDSYVFSLDVMSPNTGWSLGADYNQVGGDWAGNDLGRVSTTYRFAGTTSVAYGNEPYVWKRLEYITQMKTWTNGATASPTDRFYPNTDNIKLYYKNPQLELNKSLASAYTQTSRSNTEALIDITGNNTVTLYSSLVYNSDGTFSFDGTDDFITTGTPDIRNTSFTLQSWVKMSTLSRFNPIIGDAQYNWFGLFLDSSNNLVSQHRRSSGEDNSLTKTGYSFSTNTWYNITSVFDISSGKYMYINNELVASNSNTLEWTLAPSRGPQYIGRHSRGVPGSQDYFAGEISQVKIYNKALTAAEVKQNFEATRSRYGI